MSVNKSMKYGIRKLSVEVGSVAIGAAVSLNLIDPQVIHAEEDLGLEYTLMIEHQEDSDNQSLVEPIGNGQSLIQSNLVNNEFQTTVLDIDEESIKE